MIIALMVTPAMASGALVPVPGGELLPAGGGALVPSTYWGYLGFPSSSSGDSVGFFDIDEYPALFGDYGGCTPNPLDGSPRKHVFRYTPSSFIRDWSGVAPSDNDAYCVNCGVRFSDYASAAYSAYTTDLTAELGTTTGVTQLARELCVPTAP